MQKLLGLIRSYLFIFAFVSFALGDRSFLYFLTVQRWTCIIFNGRIGAKNQPTKQTNKNQGKPNNLDRELGHYLLSWQGSLNYPSFRHLRLHASCPHPLRLFQPTQLLLCPPLDQDFLFEMVIHGTHVIPMRWRGWVVQAVGGDCPELGPRAPCPLCSGSAADGGAVRCPTAPGEPGGPGHPRSSARRKSAETPAVLRSPRLSCTPSPAVPGETQRRLRTRRAAPSRLAGALDPASAVLGLHPAATGPAAPGLHGPGPQGYCESGCPHAPGPPPIPVPLNRCHRWRWRLKWRWCLRAGAHFCPLNLHLHQLRTCCPFRTFWPL